MVILLFLIFFIAYCVAVATVLASDGVFGGVFASHAVALLMLLALAFVVAPEELGVSRVPKGSEEFSRRLEAGRVYRLIATEPVDDKKTKILLVRDESSLDYYAIRVKIAVPMPERFTLIKGQPMAIK